MKKNLSLFVFVSLYAFVISVWMGKIIDLGNTFEQEKTIVLSNAYREQNIGEEMFDFIRGKDNVGSYVATYLLETDYGYEEWTHTFSEKEMEKVKQRQKKQSGWDAYLRQTKAIWDDVRYFPVAEFTNNPKQTVSYVNAWMAERNYNGKGVHEGTDIIATKNERGLYPIISMTDGVVTKMGWLEKGGYRIGITTKSGAYFYYAHLESYANLKIGDEVKAGDILGYMGDSGYGPEGTVGKFVVHLHLGIYLYEGEKEVSVNPYWVLRYIENRTVKCYTKE